VPLFPLPHGALLPGELLPLHVFEPRYRAMLEDVRRSDRLIAIATLLPGFEAAEDGRPALAPVVGLGRLVKDRRNPDGTSDIVLHGLLRGEIVEESGGRPYRLAQILLRPDGDLHPAEAWRLRRALMAAIARRLRTKAFRFDLTAAFDSGALIDRIASSLDLAPDRRVEVMQAVNLMQRTVLLESLLRERDHRQRLIEIIPSLHAFSLGLERGRGPETSS
jgi:Lon protease-like protein